MDKSGLTLQGNDEMIQENCDRKEGGGQVEPFN